MRENFGFLAVVIKDEERNPWGDLITIRRRKVKSTMNNAKFKNYF
jgi:hypothetical protein